MSRRQAVEHGPSAYGNGLCKCARCRKAWREYGPRADAMDRMRARYMARGLTGKGKPRSEPYDDKAIRLMEKFGLRPDPRWVP